MDNAHTSEEVQHLFMIFCISGRDEYTSNWNKVSFWCGQATEGDQFKDSPCNVALECQGQRSTDHVLNQ